MAAVRQDLRKYRSEYVEEEGKGAPHELVVVPKNSKNCRALVKEAEELLIDHSHIVIRGSGPLVSVVAAVAEGTRRLVGDLYMTSKIVPDDLVLTYKLKEGEEGEPEMQVTRFRSGFQVCLSRYPLDKTEPGYHEPVEAESGTLIYSPARTQTRGPHFKGGKGKGGKGYDGGKKGGFSGGKKGKKGSKGKKGGKKGGGGGGKGEYAR